jgi:hypothetical protein
MIFGYTEGPGGDPAAGYQPICLGATDRIDDTPTQDYTMGAMLPGAPGLAAAIGVRMWAVPAGSIHYVRCASNFDRHVDYRGLARLVDIFAGR